MSIEKFDDISFESYGNPTDLMQTKHHLGLIESPTNFEEVVASIRIFLRPALEAITQKRDFRPDWARSGPMG